MGAGQLGPLSLFFPPLPQAGPGFVFESGLSEPGSGPLLNPSLQPAPGPCWWGQPESSSRDAPEPGARAKPGGFAKEVTLELS